MGEKPKREIIIYGNYFWEIYDKQSEKVKIKIDWTIGLVRDLEVIPEKYFKNLTGTSLYEIRVNVSRNIFRIFCFFDKGKLVVIINGFQKKTQKTPKKELDRALKIQKMYFDEKKN